LIRRLLSSSRSVVAQAAYQRHSPRHTPKEIPMSVFGKIMSAIFGSAHGAAPAPQPSAPGSSPASSPATSPAPSAPSAAPSSAAPQVDVEAVLTKLAAQNKEKLDWRKSIVDLMKLLNLDSSLTARKELADELHYTGDKNDSATMNIWLHKQVMQKLAENGGKVPDELRK
jgi:3-oxoacyl-ACP reductase-like protein